MSSSDRKLFVSKRTVLPEDVKPAIIEVSAGKITKILSFYSGDEMEKELNFGDLVLMPGIVDSHVHVDEPGRTEWEGFYTATRAAAAGGVTTIVDMPLNSMPPTTSVDNLKIKVTAAEAKTFVDVGFWGGVVPGNHKNIKPMVECGVVGFKCFLCPSGVEEFGYVNEEDVKSALAEMKDLKTVLAFHAEREVPVSGPPKGDPFSYDTYLKTRPGTMEVEAIKMVTRLCEEYNCHCHIVHLSTSEALGQIKEAKEKQLPITAETCHHYLHLSAENIPKSATEYKCCPPIRRGANRELLWEALKTGTLDMVVSDHSPCPEQLKQGGNFLTAWGGISSLQFALPLFWTEARTRGLSFRYAARLLSSAPARLCGLEDRKGVLAVGLDADFVVWDPDEMIRVQHSEIFHKNKLTPYLGEKLCGKVIATIVRGNFVYRDGKFCNKPLGQLLLRDAFLSDVMNM